MGTTMKLSEGFSVLTYGIATAVGMIMSFVFLSLAIKQMPLSLAYPIWTGIGAVGSIIVGVILFHDQIPNITWVFIIMLIVGIIGIKMTAGH